MIETPQVRAEVTSAEIERALAALRIDPAHVIAMAEEGQRHMRLRARKAARQEPVL